MRTGFFLLMLAACSHATGHDKGTSGVPGDDTGAATRTDSGGDTGGEDPFRPDIVVNCDGTADFTRIQDAIDAATSGDTVGVEPCTYHERIDFLGKSVDLYGIEGSAETVIDGDGGGTVVTLDSGESYGTRFAGFTVTGGAGTTGASGIEVQGAVVAFEDLLLTGNGEAWAVISSDLGFIEATDLTVSGNIVTASGQAIYVPSGSFVATGLDVDCDGGAQAIYAHVALEVSDSTLNCDSGYGITNHHGEIQLRRSRVTGGISGVYTFDSQSTPSNPDSPDDRVIVYNSAIGGGSVGLDVLYEHLELANSVLWGGDAALRMTECDPASWAENTVFAGATCGITSDRAFSATYSAFWNDTNSACGLSVTPATTADPLFVSFPDDLHLQASSPLVDQGDPDARWNDADGSRNDIGMYGGPLPPD